MFYKSIIAGIGSYLPERVLSNHELAQKIDTSDEWIVQRTGIRERRIASDTETTTDLGVKAGQIALKNAGLEKKDVDLIILATATPDYTFPASATIIQSKLGITQGCAFDIAAVCSGFIYALSVADNFIRLGKSKTALVIGAETFSRILDWNDRSTCVLFGDGAGAIVLQAIPEKEAGSCGIHETYIRSDGRYGNLLYVDGGPSKTKTVGHLRMTGRAVYKHAVQNISEAMEQVIQKAGIDLQEIDWFVPHQANYRILEAVAKRHKIPMNKIICTVEKHANTSAASVPLALDSAIKSGQIKRNDLILTEAFGGGFAWGAALFQY